MVSGNPNPRELKGKLIASMKNAVKRISEQTYRVSSQNGNGKYYDVQLSEENEWQCNCADFSYRHERDQDQVTACKHIFAVEFSKRLREEVKKELVVQSISKTVYSVSHHTSKSLVLDITKAGVFRDLSVEIAKRLSALTLDLKK